MLNTSYMIKLSIILFAISVLFQPKLSYSARTVHRFVQHRQSKSAHGAQQAHRVVHYRDHPRFGLQVPVIPNNHYIARINGEKHYYHDGLYYKKLANNYVIVPPPIGAVVPAIPEEFKPVVINGETYHMHNGIYYLYTSGGYQVVLPPVVINGVTYYVHDGTYYVDNSGDYQVVPPPIGAVVATIPQDFQPVVINGETYYSHNGIYYLNTSGGYQVVPQPAEVVPSAAGDVNQTATDVQPSSKAAIPEAASLPSISETNKGTETMTNKE